MSKDTCNVSTDRLDRAIGAAALAGAFLCLTPQVREDIANRLGLLPPDYLQLGRVELAKRIFGAAKENGRVADLWDAVQGEHAQDMGTNPYRSVLAEVKP